MAQKPYRVLHIASWFPSRLHRTLGNFVERHIQAISTMHPSTVLAIYTDPEAKEIRFEKSEEKNIEVLRVFHPAKQKLWQRRKAFFLALNELEVNGSLPFSLVHLHVTFPHGWMARWLKRKRQLPYLITDHWTGYHNGNAISPLQRMHDKKVAAEASMITPVTQHLADAMSKLGLQGPYQIIPNVVDTALFQIAEKTPKPFRFIHVSHLVDEHKNVSGILKTFKKLCITHENVHLSIVGDGQTAPYVQLAQELGIASKVTIEGEQPLQQIAKKMAQSHALLLFSNYENLPCVIVEALAAGLPIISTNVGGISEHISPHLGILLPPKEEAELLSAMQTMIDKYEEFSPELLRAYALDHFSISAVAKAYTSAYTAILAP